MKMKTLIFIIPAFYLLCGGNASEAAPVALPWSTTYNCPTWTQSNGLSEATVNCDSLKGWGTWTCSGGKEEQITSAANYTAGGGGNGQRQWVGDGVNSNSGGLWIEFASVQSEFWVRWYMRYQAGFKWSIFNYDKILYVNSGQSNPVVIEWYGSDESAFWVLTPSANYRSGTGKGWTSTMGGAGSDGLWHYYEAHLKTDTNGSNGVAEMWIDGTQVLADNSVNYNTTPGWNFILIGSNQASPNNGGCMAVDFDDIKISNTGYIGPLSTLAKPQRPTLSPIP